MTIQSRAEELISNHVAGAAAAAAIPIPLLDLVAVTAVQLAMMRKLGRLYGAQIGVDAAGAVGVGLFGALLPRVAASALKILPGIGTIGGAVAQSALSGAATWALAQFGSHGHPTHPFGSHGHPTHPFGSHGHPTHAQAHAQAHTDVARSLARAERLRRRGLLTEEEYARTRAELLEAL